MVYVWRDMYEYAAMRRVELYLWASKPGWWGSDTITTKTVKFTTSTQFRGKYPLDYLFCPLSPALCVRKIATYTQHHVFLHSCLAGIRCIWHQRHLVLNVLTFIPGIPEFKSQSNNQIYWFRFFTRSVCPFSQLSGSGLMKIGSLQYRSTSFLSNRFIGATCFLKDNISSASRGIPRILWDSIFIIPFTRASASWASSIYHTFSHFLQIHMNIVLPFTPRSTEVVSFL
jgi:hypothetical protein